MINLNNVFLLIKVQRLETGSIDLNILGSKEVIEFIICIFEIAGTSISQRFTHKGKLERVVSVKEISDTLADIKKKAASVGIECPPFDDAIRALLEDVARKTTELLGESSYLNIQDKHYEAPLETLTIPHKYTKSLPENELDTSDD